MRALRWAERRRAQLVDVVLVLFVGGTAQYEIWADPLFDDGIPGPRVANSLLFLVITLPLLARRRLPVAVFFVVLMADGLQTLLIDRVHSDQPPLQEWLTALVIFYSVAAYAAQRPALAAGAAGGAAVVVTDLALLGTGNARADEAIPSWFLLAAAFGLGFVLRGRRFEAIAHARRAERAEAEREEKARAAVAEERARIARELHDIVAHAISVIVVQAQAAQRVLEGEQPSAREALESMETTGRQALDEMRRLLGMLRKEDRELALAPQPSLERVDLLVQQVREAGLPVDLRIEGRRRPLAPGVDLSAYRIVQEALTNALKHAGPASARVVITYGRDEVEVEVVDDGRGRSPGGGGGGHGLVGMRERAALVGGSLKAGVTDGRGYAVRARLPG